MNNFGRFSINQIPLFSFYTRPRGLGARSPHLGLAALVLLALEKAKVEAFFIFSSLRRRNPLNANLSKKSIKITEGHAQRETVIFVEFLRFALGFFAIGRNEEKIKNAVFCYSIFCSLLNTKKSNARPIPAASHAIQARSLVARSAKAKGIAAGMTIGSYRVKPVFSLAKNSPAFTATPRIKTPGELIPRGRKELTLVTANSQRIAKAPTKAIKNCSD